MKYRPELFTDCYRLGLPCDAIYAGAVYCDATWGKEAKYMRCWDKCSSIVLGMYDPEKEDLRLEITLEEPSLNPLELTVWYEVYRRER
jgi:hypothetical protein